jgi:AcrR family transcriptional regulator
VRVQMDISDVAQMGPAVPARERILTTAYRLFTRRGIRAVGNDEVIAVSGVAKATLYRHFPSKNDLVLAVLQRREELWTLGLVEQQSRLRGETTEEQLLAIFDVFHDWFQKREDFDGCSFINVLLELGAAHPAGQASIQYLDNIRTMVRERAEAAGLVDVDNFAHSWHILMKGSIIAAAEGDLQAAQRAQAMGRSLIERHRPPADG